MEVRDLAQFVDLRQTATGDTVTVIALDADTVTSSNWTTKAEVTQPLHQFLKEHEPLYPPSEMPRYDVVVIDSAPGFVKSVRVSLDESDPAFCDECEPLTLHANPDGLAVLEQYLEGISSGESWLTRESRGSAEISTQEVQADPGLIVTLSEATNRNRYPSGWLSLLVEAEPRQDPEEPNNIEPNNMLEICVRDEGLAQNLFAAIVSGALRLEP